MMSLRGFLSLVAWLTGHGKKAALSSGPCSGQEEVIMDLPTALTHWESRTFSNILTRILCFIGQECVI